MAFFQVCDDEDAVRPMVDVYRSGAGFEGTDEYEPPGADNSMVATGLPFACLVSDPSVVLGAFPTGEEPGAQPAWDAAQGSCLVTYRQAADLQGDAHGPSDARGDTNPEHPRLAALTPNAGFLILRLRRYPAWHVTENGRRISAMPARDDGLMAVPVPQGAVELTFDWTATPDVIAGRWLSAIALALVTALCLLERRFSRPRL
jgi:hypothetical protein